MSSIKTTVLKRNHLLKTERSQRGWTQAQLADVLGVTTKTVIRWEQGKNMPQPAHRQQLGILFGRRIAHEFGLLWDAHEDQEGNREEQAPDMLAFKEVMLVSRLEDADGVLLLDRLVPHLVRRDPQGAHALVQRLHGVPLALTLMGKYLVCSVRPLDRWPLQSALACLDVIQGHFCSSMQTTSEQYWSHLARWAHLSLCATIALCDQQLSLQAQMALRSLTIFPAEPYCFSEEAALAISQQSIEVLDELCKVGLLEHWGTRSYALHQAIVDYVHIKAKC